MAHRRGIQLLSRHATALISLKSNPRLAVVRMLTSNPQSSNLGPDLDPSRRIFRIQSRYFSSSKDDGSEDEEEDEDDEEDEESEIDDFSEGEGVDAPEPARVYSPKEKEAEAADIGYKVVGPLQRSDRVFKPYEPVFAVVQIGSHQFKVSNGDCVFTERLKFCEVNDKLILNKVLMLGSPTQTIIGRPTLPEAAVHAVVEEHALDAKVIIFKKKKRKNYRRCNGHRQELTKLRITDIQGIEKPEVKPEIKPLKLATEKPQKKPMVAA